ncbi:MAG: hypothetical protein A3B70_07235 [Deltaproteobacteria bacterium RIFCSPHIGHO2_02_FULL_40_11]|nr:MAG: hypothetical protein A3B70_07235 [Deltaproteobacteria bacterium RIFCSPHIGHO2_02_FULL_40_11]
MKRFCTPQHLILLSASFVLLYFAALPLFLLILKSLSPENIESYQELLKQSNWIALLNTLKLCLITTSMTVVIGVPLAWLLHKTDLPKKSLWKSLFAIPYIIPPYIGAIAWIKLLNPNSGNLNLLLMQVFGLEKAPFNIYSLLGTSFILGLFFYSFIFLSCINALEKMDDALEEAARTCGASRLKTFKDITLPLLTPALASGMILVFMATAASFGVPALVAMPERIFVLTTKIYTHVLSYSGGISKASALAMVLMAVGFLGLWLSTLLLRNKRYTTLTGKFGKGDLIHLKKMKWPTVFGLSTVWFCLVALPLLTIVISSFLKVYGGELTLSNMSLAKYKYVLFGFSQTGKAFKNSLIFAVIASTLSVFIGAFVAYLKAKTQMKGRNLIDFFATLPYVTPGIVVAIALILTFSGNLGLNLYNTLWILIVAYTVKYISFAIRNTVAALEQVDTSLEEAGKTCGAGWLKVFFTILIPILKPTLIASWFLIFMPTFSELTMSILLVGPETETIGTLLFNLQNYDDPQSACVLATVIVCVILTANFTVKKLTQGKYGV